MVEHRLPKPEVAGSIPVSRSRFSARISGSELTIQHGRLPIAIKSKARPAARSISGTPRGDDLLPISTCPSNYRCYG
jgi:hypothetical protein